MLSYSEKFKLRQGDFDASDNLRASAVLDIFQTIAAAHAEILGVGFAAMMEKNIAWVITKVKFDCITALHAGDEVVVETRPLPKGTVDYVRDFYIYAPSGELAIKGSSQWVLIDFTSRRILRPTFDFEGEFTAQTAYETRKIERVAPFDGTSVHAHAVTNSDQDHNGHTNNVRYADMAYDAQANALPIKRANINFIAETKVGDTIDVAVRTDANATEYCGYSRSTPCFTMRIEF